MSLKDKGFRYYASPDRKQTAWLHPVEQKALRPDWLDITDMPTEQMVEFFMQAELAA